MAIYKLIFPTKWPILDLFIEIWKLKVYTAVARPSQEALAYEYLMFFIAWGDKQIIKIRLYDTERRIRDRLTPYLDTQEMTEGKLKTIIKIANEELVKLKERG